MFTAAVPTIVTFIVSWYSNRTRHSTRSLVFALTSSFDNDNAITSPPINVERRRKKRGKKSFFCYFFLPFRSRSSISSSFLIFHFRWFGWCGALLCHSFSSTLCRIFSSSPFFSFSVSLNWISSLHHHNWLLHKKEREKLAMNKGEKWKFFS